MQNTGLPYYLRIKKEIKDGISTNRWGTGKRLPKESVLAKMYRTSRATVAKGINELVKEGLLIRIKGTGTFKAEDILSRFETKREGEKRLQSHPVCIVTLYDNLNELTGYPLKDIVKGIQDEVNKYDQVQLQTFAVTNASIFQQSNRALYNVIAEGAVRGVITLANFARADFEYFVQQGIPSVRINSQMLEENIYTVSTDFFAGVYEAVKHLVSLGHRKIGFVGIKGETKLSFQDMSIRGYEFAMKRLGLAGEEKIILMPEGRDEKKDKASIKESLSVISTCSALYVIGDALAVWLARTMREKIRSIALVGCGNYLKDRMEKVTLTSLDCRNEEVGRKAVEILLKSIKDEKPDIHSVLVEPELIVRESTLNHRRM